MATIITRETGATAKGSPLTNAEVDNNFINLNTEVTPSRPTIRPTLLLDFAKAKSVDSRITFTRSSAAMYYDDKGVLQLVRDNKPRIDFDPSTGECKGLLIEEQRTNLLTYSENFDNAAWEKPRASITANTIVAPDGTLTGDKITEDTTVGGHLTRRSLAFAASTAYTASFYLKAGTRTAGTFLIFDNASAIGAWHINLLTGELVLGGASLATTATATNAGNGWWRVAVAFTSTASPSGSYFDFRLSNVWPVTSNTGMSYTGDGYSDLYIWGAQLEAGAFPTSYIPSVNTFTSRASSATYFDSTGVLRTAGVNQPRYGYGYDSASGKWVSQGLVLESAATNLSTTDRSNPTVGNSATYVSITRASINFLDKSLAHDCSLNGTSGTWGWIANHVTTAYNTVYTHSVFIKKKNLDSVIINLYNASFPDSGVLFTFSTETAQAWGYTGANSLSFKVDKYSDGWYRISHTVITGSSGDTTVQLQSIRFSGTGFNSGDGVYFAGIQFEPGYVATSYIPTYGASATRAADVSSSAATTRVADYSNMTGTNFSSWFNAAEGTIYFEAQTAQGANSYPYSLFGSSTQNRIFSNYTTNSRIIAGIRVNNTFEAAETTPNNSAPINTFGKGALAYKVNDFGFSWNGAAALTDTSTALPIVQKLDIGNNGGLAGNWLNGTIKKISYYPKRLSNTELQALTK